MSVGGKGISLGGGASVDGKVLKRTVLKHRVTGADNILQIQSGYLASDMFMSLAANNFVTEEQSKTLAAENLLVRIGCCGGGGGGAWGGTSGYGGFPGQVVERTFRVSDLISAGLIPFVIGGGGGPGGSGGITTFGIQGDWFFISAGGGFRGGNNDSEEQAHHSYMEAFGWSGTRVAFATVDNFGWAKSGIKGPGGGGSHATNKPLTGGFGSRFQPGQTVGAADGAAGNQHNPLLFDSWGSGGGGKRGTTTGFQGGPGGFPGGGGGGCQVNNASGAGANGALKIQFILEEWIDV